MHSSPLKTGIICNCNTRHLKRHDFSQNNGAPVNCFIVLTAFKAPSSVLAEIIIWSFFTESLYPPSRRGFVSFLNIIEPGLVADCEHKLLIRLSSAIAAFASLPRLLLTIVFFPMRKYRPEFPYSPVWE